MFKDKLKLVALHRRLYKVQVLGPKRGPNVTWQGLNGDSAALLFIKDWLWDKEEKAP